MPNNNRIRNISPTNTSRNSSSSELVVVNGGKEAHKKKRNMESFDIRMRDNKNNNNNNNNQAVDDDVSTRESTNRKRIVQTLVDLFVIIIILVIFGLVYILLDPNIAYFQCNDTDIFYPYKKDTVAFWVVGIYGAIGPIIFIVLVELLNAKIINFCSDRPSNMNSRSKLRTFMICTFHSISLFLLGIAITLLLTEIGKRWVGRLRPHFMSVCKPDFSKINCTTATLTGFVYNSISTGDNFCTGDPATIKEARVSFPSGHSSFSAYTMLFLIIYLEARLYLLKFRYVKPLIQMAAFIAAYVTAISRVPDYFHRGSDVIGGSVLGIIIALFITLVLGRVLWEYNAPTKRYDFDQKKYDEDDESF